MVIPGQIQESGRQTETEGKGIFLVSSFTTEIDCQFLFHYILTSNVCTFCYLTCNADWGFIPPIDRFVAIVNCKAKHGQDKYPVKNLSSLYCHCSSPSNMTV